MKNFLKVLMATSAMALVSSQGFAATATGNASATVVAALSVAQTTPLQFGNLSSGATSGTITQDGVVTGGVEAITSTRSPATFNVTGQGSLNYSISVPASATLTSGANNMTTSLALVGASTRALSAGSGSFDVNGTLSVASNQAAGSYTGTYTVTVLYQ